MSNFLYIHIIRYYAQNRDVELDCSDIDERNMLAESYDSHNINADGDGIGCKQ
jgi:hypothetical protein